MITLKTVVQEDFTNYKVPVIHLAFPKCSFKCGKGLCQNSALAQSQGISIDEQKLAEAYINNPITKGVCCAGLEPFDTPEDLKATIKAFRAVTNDVIIVFTGYTEEELQSNTIYQWLLTIPNITVKFGRYIPKQQPHYDEVLGVKLASNNQYAKQIS